MNDSTFHWPVRIYYEDTDAAGIVYYANYLKFMERARTEWLRSRGFDHVELSRQHDIIFVVSRLNIHYQQPAYLDDELLVSARVTKTGRASFQMSQSITRVAAGSKHDATPTALCSGTIRLACLNTARMKPSAIPNFLLTELERED